MRILVTGGTGAVGAFVVRDLIQRGHTPILISRGTSRRLLSDLDEASYEMAEGDIRDRAAFDAVVERSGVHRIIHTVAMMDECQDDPVAAVEVNIVGTVNVLEAARNNGVDRVVFTSSKRAIGPITGENAHPVYRPVTEDITPQPALLYDVTKFSCERIGFNYEKIYGFEFVILRFAQSYSPGSGARANANSLSVRSKIIENSMLGQPVVIPRGGEGRDDTIYVKDVAQGIVSACLAEGLTSRVFHLGTGKLVTLWEFAEVVRGLFPGSKIEIGPGTGYRDDVGYPFECLFDISRARKELGFEPQFDLKKGIEDYVATLHALGLAPTYIP